MNEADFSPGLLPAIIQDADTGQVLMLGWMSAEALRITQDTGKVTFYSRSRGRLWTKGETSGHFLAFLGLAADCDGDALLIQARPAGPTCHLGSASCFGPAAPAGVLGRLEQRIAKRAAAGEPASYTARLLAAGVARVAQKLAEEGVETALAAACEDEAAVIREAADLLYHLLVLLKARGIALSQVLAELAAREQKASAKTSAA